MNTKINLLEPSANERVMAVALGMKTRLKGGLLQLAQYGRQTLEQGNPQLQVSGEELCRQLGEDEVKKFNELFEMLEKLAGK